jgi:xylulokinase
MVMNVSDASILFAFDLHRGRWAEQLIAGFGLPRRLYPPLVACQEIIGALTAEAAESLGLPAGIPVVGGGEDTSSAGLAIGVVQPGQAFLSLGTAGTLYIVEDGQIVHPQLLAFWHVLPDQILLGGSVVAVGGALQWARQLLGQLPDSDSLTRLATESEPGAGGLLFLPYLSGELQPINDGNARGVFLGLSWRTGRAEVARAVMEGAAYAVAHNAQIAREAGVRMVEMRAVGGPTRSPLWCQIFADVTGEPIAVPADHAGAPLGNALLAAAGVGLVADPAQVALSAARAGRVYEPDPRRHQRYQALFAIYRQLYPQLREQFATLAPLAHGEV